MEIKYKGGLKTRTQFGLVKNLGTIFRRVGGIRLGILRSIDQDGISVNMFTASYLPYEASRTYRTIMIEFERQRSKTSVEAQSIRNRL